MAGVGGACANAGGAVSAVPPSSTAKQLTAADFICSSHSSWQRERAARIYFCCGTQRLRSYRARCAPSKELVYSKGLLCVGRYQSTDNYQPMINLTETNLRLWRESCRLLWKRTGGSAGQPAELKPRDKGRLGKP